MQAEIIPKGETLFRIDTRDYDAAVKEARAAESNGKTSSNAWRNSLPSIGSAFLPCSVTGSWPKWNSIDCGTSFRKSKVGTRSGMEKAEQAFNATTDQVDQLNKALALYPIQIKEALSSLASARARLSVAVVNLDRCTVAVDFDARVKSVSIEQGQYVAPGQQVLALADDSTLEIHVPLDSRDARQWLQFNGSRNMVERPGSRT
jgi:multidrug efflux system membrane fusion protein